jgi:predicted GNAT superfamily acetyltransferase
MGTGEAWRAAEEAAEHANIRLVPLTELSDAERIRAVVDEVWGDQPPPRELLRAMQHAGSVLHGAVAGEELVGFVWGFAGFEGGIHLHSHMLAVVPRLQVHGVGFALKLAQRAVCLDHGITEIRWTYDPLVARNARFNLVKLGAAAVAVYRGFYGDMGDRLNRDDRSDRFEVRWSLLSDHVERALGGTAPPPRSGDAVLEAVGDPAMPEPKLTGAEPRSGATASIPVDIHRLKAEHPDLARPWRDASTEAFERCFDHGLVATWFDPGVGYLFERPSDP